MAATDLPVRKNLSIDAILSMCRVEFEEIPDHRACDVQFTLPDVLMCGVALFLLKDPSLLAFQRRASDGNFLRVFGVAAVPSDTQMRQILDGVNPESLRPLFRMLFRQVQRGKVLDQMRYLDQGLILSIDGVEYSNSFNVYCPKCLERKRRGADGPEYYHQMLGAVIVHPDKRQVIPLMPEPICRQDGATKNDCERNAAKRFLQRFRKDHPHLEVVVVEDGLASNGPHIKELVKANCHYILGAKDGDHQSLQEQLDRACEDGSAQTLTTVDKKSGVRRLYVWANGLRLNGAHPDLAVNYLRFLEELPSGKVREFSWVTDIMLSRGNVERIMRAARARWKIENETFNTLKNQGYQFDHNFGHGENNLSVVFALLMMLAFAIDQIQEISNRLFQEALAKAGSRRALWEDFRSFWRCCEIDSMTDLYAAVARGFDKTPLRQQLRYPATLARPPDTS